MDFRDTGDDRLPDELLDRVLDRLGLEGRPTTDLGGLADVYRAWSQRVPFDNARKLVHLAARNPAPLAGDDVCEFLEAWLAWGTGGTCWAGNGALASLLATLGFRATRAVATMLVAPDLPPNHGTVIARIDGQRFLVDASMLFGEPLLLDEGTETFVDHPSRGVSCSRRDGKWHVQWRPLHMHDGMECRIDQLAATAGEFSTRHEMTREWSPFNYALNARLNVGDRVVGVAFGQRVEIDAGGRMTQTPIDHDERRRIVVEELGIAATLADCLPAEAETPPPPTSRSARG